MTTETIASAPEGLRERKKAATRQALHQAALRLAVEKGYAEVTVDAIADAALVSRRTFSNYFGSKEDALLYGDRNRGEQLVEQLRAQPADRTAWQALRGSAVQLYTGLENLDPQWVAQLRLIRRHPAILAQQVANHGRLEQGLAEELTTRPGGLDSLAARVLAAAFLAALRAAITVWLDEGGRRRGLPEMVDRALDELAKQYA
ncbi:AcrR family transcriptional regulator [Hamadaea flava]|uniref:TetR/AcrR family transcriptional regulator n=1 Tax=Hamadaea flava TaxID=1742688 RepID=A0ABV8LJQ9_9ACTN|nr:TetR/AcrR family transcriptional regulator [Hamadaea flava]MCP2325286.1 AcrR family transcriptional regulator [Hamadaea flava]